MKKKKHKKIVIPKKESVFRFCEDTIHRIQAETGLSDYRIRVKYDNHENGGVMAEIRVDNDYLRATITLFPIFVEKYRQEEYGELTEALCHEVFHIKTSKIEDMAVSRWGTPDIVRSEVERLTELYGRLIYKVMKFEGKFKNIKAKNGTSPNKHKPRK